ncbi:hypothetical protein [Persicitalea sp.]|uniref:hypothetical protein n=1 Tax=Persicitalea sp. TaxID=3100273 RepID=UPI003593F36C
MDKKVSVLIPLMLFATVGCQYRGFTGKRPKNDEVLQYMSVLGTIDDANRLETKRLEYLIPPTFSHADGDALGNHSKMAIRESLEKTDTAEVGVLVPSQFSVSKIISAQEQQRAMEEEADEKLYRTQSDPAYYENTKRAFQAEYKRRMGAKGLN